MSAPEQSGGVYRPHIVKAFLIWSNEHRAWWNQNRHGYVPSRAEAGRFSLAEAMEICIKANLHDGNFANPSEAIVPLDPDEFLTEKRKALDDLSRQMAEAGVDDIVAPEITEPPRPAGNDGSGKPHPG